MKLFWNQDKGGCIEVDEYGSSKIWKEGKFGLKRLNVHQR